MNAHQQNLIEELAHETGVYATSIYCQVTGKLIGKLDDDAVADLFASLPENLDDDDIKNELFTRTLSAMRPSPAWIMRRMDTATKILNRDPISILSYLLNRFYEPVERNDGKNMSLETRIWHYHNRVRMYKNISFKWEEHKPNLEKLMLILLEVDSKFNLALQTMPKDLSPNSTLFHPSDDFIATCESWRDALVAKREREIAASELSDRSFRNGNSPLKQAYMQEFIRQTPPSPTKEKEIQREVKRQHIGNLFDELEAELRKPGTSGPTHMTTVRTPKPRFNPGVRAIQTGAGFKFGGLKKQEA